MAISVSTWVWDHSKSRHSARLVLLRIADGVRTDAGWTWPSVRELALKTNLTERAVRAAITELAGLGELDVQYNAGPGGCNRYRVVTPAKFSGVQSFQGENSSGGQNFPPSESAQRDGHTPAKSSPPAKSAPLKKTTPTPENFADGTVINHEDSTSPLKDSADGAGSGALFGDDKPPARKRARPGTATRIPDDFAIDAGMRKWAAEKIPGFDIDAETEVFIDYWRQRADKGALKADWIATWRTWMRRAAKEAAPPPRPPYGSPNGSRRRGGAAGDLSREVYGQGRTRI